ncbi:hypothetical protein UFOVP276_20 [uncultured Caudovirales phage]|uniref:Uncharacterized protein n=1 Tax=uncultured Caudovirales phage TaxID=2100421 RepID=A0A6J5LEL7_9CAUD|nr:hypothetical protein UFOVP127_157 [uncultured Caudovirales phage]CAB4134846.1 hypothetical protein UFOVP276_20 [uncultured Caudovirales phage]
MFIVGEFTVEEEKTLKERGWKLEKAPGLFGLAAKSIFIDNDAFKVMNGPDWEKGPKVKEVEIEISDISITHRVVKIPTTCPKCKRDLTEERTLETWSFLDQGRESRLDVLNGGLLEDDFVTESSNFIGPVSIYCSGCGQKLAAGTYKDTPLPAAHTPQMYKIEVWASQDCAGEMDWTIFDHYHTHKDADEAFDVLLGRKTYDRLRLVDPEGVVIFSTDTRKKKNAKRVR